MRRLLQMLGIGAIIKHTHELRLVGWYGLEKGFKNSILVKGTQDDCYKHLEELANEKKCGVGLLLNNGGYRIVILEEEIANAKKEAGVELYATLSEVLDLFLPIEVRIKIKTTLNKAKVKPFL